MQHPGKLEGHCSSSSSSLIDPLEEITKTFIIPCSSISFIPGEQRWVAERRGDGEVAVQCDHTKRFDAGSHAQHIGGCPEITHEVSKLPDSPQDVGTAKGDHNHAHDEVSNSQRGNEKIGDSLEPLEPQDGGNHQHVSCTERSKLNSVVKVRPKSKAGS